MESASSSPSSPQVRAVVGEEEVDIPEALVEDVSGLTFKVHSEIVVKFCRENCSGGCLHQTLGRACSVRKRRSVSRQWLQISRS